MRPIVYLVVGVRPNYIKANPVFQRLEELDKFDLVLAGNSKEHTIPDLWDGKAAKANRISAIIDDYFTKST